jgi:hypothetical protein
LFSVRFCAVHPKNAGDCRLLQFFEVPYNECGYRTAERCGSKPPNGIRVAVLGTSISRSYAVAYEESWAARATAELTKRCGRPVEFQNVSMMWKEPRGPAWDQFDSKVDEALGLGPDVILLMLAPWDIWKYGGEAVQSSAGASPAARSPKREWVPFYQPLHEAAETFRRLREDSRAVLVLRHLIYIWIAIPSSVSI